MAVITLPTIPGLSVAPHVCVCTLLQKVLFDGFLWICKEMSSRKFLVFFSIIFLSTDRAVELENVKIQHKNHHKTIPYDLCLTFKLFLMIIATVCLDQGYYC